MIELSIVLLILSLLVGSLLVGRQIVDRAKIQRIIFEFDYYEKAFHQFYDTYRFVPGNNNYKTCMKYGEFTAERTCPNGSKLTAGHMCRGIVGAVLGEPSPSDRVMQTDLNPASLSGWPEDLYASGLLEGKTLEGNSCLCSRSPYRNHVVIGNLNEAWSNFNFPNSSFDHETVVKLAGFHFQKQHELLNKYGLGNYQYNLFYHSNKKLNSSLSHEFDNANFRNALDHHNVIIFDKARNSTDSSGRRNQQFAKTSALDAKKMSILDAKIDDGRPGSGRLLAIKGGAAHTSDATDDIHNSVCYDKAANEVDRAIYESNSEIKYGCNIIKVMEDVK